MPSIFNETNLCYKAVKNNSDYILYVNGWADDEYCPYGKAEAYCKKIVQKKDDGESCSANSDCKSDLCEDEKCFQREDGESCETHANCGIFSFCDYHSNTCKPLAKEGESCTSDYGCGFDLVCNKKCIKPFSIENGERSDNAWACKSGFYFLIQKQGKYEYYCGERKLLTPTCSDLSSKTCKFEYTTGETRIVAHDLCLPNWDNKPHCEESSGNKLWKEYIETYEEEKKKVDPTNVKVTSLRHLFWTRKTDIAYWRYMEHYFLEGAEKCVHDYFEQTLRPNYYFEMGRRPEKFIHDYLEKSNTPDDNQLKLFLQ